MKKYYLYNYILLCFLFIIKTNYGQIISNVNFKIIDNNKIKITYDLMNCPPKTEYDLKVKLLGKDIDIKKIEGDFLRVNSGKNKTIIWDVLQDAEDLKGNIAFEVKIIKTYSTKIIGGPENAILSLILPGLGDVFVNKDVDLYDKNKPGFGPFYTAISYITSIILTGVFNSEYKKYYLQYQNSRTRADMDSSFKGAENNYTGYQISLGFTIGILVFDVINVIRKGVRNAEQQRNYSLNNIKNITPIIKFNSNSFQLGFVKNF